MSEKEKGKCIRHPELVHTGVFISLLLVRLELPIETPISHRRIQDQAREGGRCGSDATGPTEKERPQSPRSSKTGCQSWDRT